MRAQVTLPGLHVLAGDLAEAAQCLRELLVLRVDHRIGPVGGDHAPCPAAGADRVVVLELIQRTLGGGDDLDVEALEQRARAERLRLQRRGDGVVVKVCRAGIEPHAQPEHLMEHMVQPHRGRRATKQVEMLRQQPPSRARIDRRTGTVPARNAQPVQRHALAVQHAEQVVVRHQQQFGGIGEWRIAGEPGRIGVAMRTDDGQIAPPGRTGAARWHAGPDRTRTGGPRAGSARWWQRAWWTVPGA